MTTSNLISIAAIVAPLMVQTWWQARRTRQHQDATTNRRLNRLEVAVTRLRDRLNAHTRDPRGHATIPPQARQEAP